MVLTDENKSRFNRFADGLGSALGRHSEWRMPSIGKPDMVQQTEVKARESLLSPAQKEEQRKRSPSIASVATMVSSASVERQVREDQEKLRAAQEAVMQRPNFAIDAIGDSDGEEDDTGGAEDDAGVMDEVRSGVQSGSRTRSADEWNHANAQVEAFLKANDTDEKGIEGKEKELANGERSCRGCVEVDVLKHLVVMLRSPHSGTPALIPCVHPSHPVEFHVVNTLRCDDEC
jgi:hypothetical protein